MSKSCQLPLCPIYMALLRGAMFIHVLCLLMKMTDSLGNICVSQINNNPEYRSLHMDMSKLSVSVKLNKVIEFRSREREIIFPREWERRGGVRNRERQRRRETTRENKTKGKERGLSQVLKLKYWYWSLKFDNWRLVLALSLAQRR